MTCKGQIAEQNANEHVLAIAPQGNLQLSPNFFWNFSHPIRMFLTLRQGFLTIFWIFQTGLMYLDLYVPQHVACTAEYIFILYTCSCTVYTHPNTQWCTHMHKYTQVYVRLRVKYCRWIKLWLWSGIIKETFNFFTYNSYFILGFYL